MTVYPVYLRNAIIFAAARLEKFGSARAVRKNSLPTAKLPDPVRTAPSSQSTRYFLELAPQKFGGTQNIRERFVFDFLATALAKQRLNYISKH